MRHDRTVDLLCAGGPDGQQAAAAAQAGGPHPYVLVHAPSHHVAARLLSLARSRSIAAFPVPHPTSKEPTAASSVPARASLFVRLALHDAERESLASLYLVDLVGNAPLPSASEAAALAERIGLQSESGKPTTTPGSLVAERRGLNRQHAAVNRMLAELGALEHHGASTRDGGSGQQLLGARDSRLTQQLAPLLVGSCRTQLLACVHSDADHFTESCATLRAASHALSIRAPCLRLSGVPLIDVPLVQPQAVLPPEVPLSHVRRVPRELKYDSSFESSKAAVLLKGGSPHRAKVEPFTRHVIQKPEDVDGGGGEEYDEEEELCRGCDSTWLGGRV